MKKKLLFWIAVLTLRGSPQSGDVDTLYYLHDTTRFIPEYAIAAEIFNIHTRFFPSQFWQAYQIVEVHLLFRPSKIGDTIKSISFYKDTLQKLIYSQQINIILDSNNVYPNWLRIIVDNRTTITGEIEVPTWWGDLCEVEPSQTSGNTIGFYDGSQTWGSFHDLPVKLIIEKIPLGVKNNFQDDYGFKLEQNYPNPFNPSTKIKYTIPASPNPSKGGALVQLKVYDVLGNEVATLVNEFKPTGSYEVEFNSHSDKGQNVTSGVYFYQLKAGSYFETKKMILLR